MAGFGVMAGFLAVFLLVQQTWAIEEASLSEADRRLYWQALELDELGNDKPVPGIPGGYVSPFGIQIHPSCFEYAQAGSASKRKEAEAGFERWARAAFREVTRCESKYPELKPYLRQWISQFRRMRVTCTSKSQRDAKFSGINLPHGAALSVVLSDYEREGIEVDPEKGLAALPVEHRSVVVFPRDVFTPAITEDPLGAFGRDHLDTMIHEGLHSTQANNHSDHNCITSYRPEKGKAWCSDDNIAADRISIVSQLCSNTEVWNGKKVPEAMFDRVSGCGIGKCERLFADDHHGTSDLLGKLNKIYLPNKGLGKEKAKSLCSRIYDEGACAYDLRTQGKELARGNPTLKAVGKKVRARLEKLFVPAAARIAPEVLAMFPGAISSFKGTPCFDALISQGRGGALTLTARGRTLAARRPSGAAASPSRYFDDAMIDFKNAVSRAPECQDEAGKELHGQLDSFHDRAGLPFRESFYKDAVARRYAGEAEALWPGADRFYGDKYLATLLGDELTREYIGALKKLHYQSRDVDCVALGYTAERRAGELIGDTMRAARMRIPIICPH